MGRCSMKRIIDKETNLFIRDDFTFDESIEIGLDVEPAQGLYQPKWNGTSWEEGATQEYIDSLKSQAEPQEPTETKRLEALEMLMVDILGGGF